MFWRVLSIALLGTLSSFAADGVTTIGENQFNKEISSGLVLVEFYGPWCGPCKRMAPELEKVAQEMQGKLKVLKVNIDQSRGLMDTQNVTSVPTLILYKNGNEKGRLVGFRSQKEIETFVKNNQ